MGSLERARKGHELFLAVTTRERTQFTHDRGFNAPRRDTAVFAYGKVAPRPTPSPPRDRASRGSARRRAPANSLTTWPLVLASGMQTWSEDRIE